MNKNVKQKWVAIGKKVFSEGMGNHGKFLLGSLFALASGSTAYADEASNLYIMKSGLSAASSQSGTAKNISVNKGPGVPFDGNESQSNQVSEIIVDLGGVYVVDSSVVKFTSNFGQYHISEGRLPAGVLQNGGDGMESGKPNFANMIIVPSSAGKSTDSRRLPSSPCRYVRYGFRAFYAGSWSQPSVSEIEVFGRPYTPVAGDQIFLNRSAWVATAFADYATENHDSEFPQAIDGNLSNIWRVKQDRSVGDWYKVDLGASVEFNQIDIVFNIAPTTPESAIWDVLVSDDGANWGVPVVTIDHGSQVIASFPLQKKRYLKLVSKKGGQGWYSIDELNLLAPAIKGAVSAFRLAAGKSRRIGHFRVGQPDYTLTGKRIHQAKSERK